MGFSQKRNASGVRWPDEDDSKNPISNTIPGSEMEKADKPSDLSKITTHKNYPLGKVKPIIKQTRMRRITERESLNTNYLSFHPSNLGENYSTPSSQSRMALTEQNTRRVIPEAYDQYNEEIQEAIREHAKGHNFVRT